MENGKYNYSFKRYNLYVFFLTAKEYSLATIYKAFSSPLAPIQLSLKIASVKRSVDAICAFILMAVDT